jgi:hypothetical protein
MTQRPLGVFSHFLFFLGGGVWESAEKIQVSLKSDKNNGTLHADRYTVLMISHSVVLRMRMFETNFVKKIKATFYFQYLFFNCAESDIMWKNIVEPDRSQVEHVHCMLDT